MIRDRPGRRVPTGAERGAVSDQPRVAMASLKVFDGRITAEALAASGW